MAGWICLHRKLTEWEWYGDINVSRLFIHCLLKANHKPNRWQGIDIPRGSFVTGRKTLAVETGLSEQKIRTALNKLISTNEITTKSTNKNTLLTVVKYSDYQDKGERSTSKTTSNPTNKQPTDNQRITTNNNDNKENNETKGAKLPTPTQKPSVKKQTLKTYLAKCEAEQSDPIPEDSIVFENAEKLGLPFEFVSVAWEQFKDYWLTSKGGAPKSDWVGTFNNCLKDDGYGAYKKSQAGEWYLTTKGKSTETLMGANQ